MFFLSTLIFLFFSTEFSIGQTKIYQNGLVKNDPISYTLINSNIYLENGTFCSLCSLSIKNDLISEVGKKILIKSNSQVIDMKGKFLYPSFIEIFSNYGIENNLQKSKSSIPIYESSKNQQMIQNDAVHADYNSFSTFKYNDELASKFRESGFGSILSHRDDGLVRGAGVMSFLADPKNNNAILSHKMGNFFSFHNGSSQQTYPTSLMGAFALHRQLKIDANYQKISLEQKISELTNYNQNLSLIPIFDAGNRQQILRSQRLGQELEIPFVIKTLGDEYLIANELKKSTTYIVPINFPKAPLIRDLLDLDLVSYSQMKHWQVAPANLSILKSKSIDFIITSHGLKDLKDFLINIKIAKKYGLKNIDIINALTTKPAKLLKIDHLLGSLSVNKKANFLVLTDTLFSENSYIQQNWVLGKIYGLIETEQFLYKQEYNFDFQNFGFRIKSNINDDENQFEVMKDTFKIATDIIFETKDRLTLKSQNKSLDFYIIDFYKLNDSILLSIQDISSKNTENFKFKIQSIKSDSNHHKKDTLIDIKTFYQPKFPSFHFGTDSIPKYNNYFFTNATIWTSEKDSVLENYDLIVKNGKIVELGKSLVNKLKYKKIDCTGKYLTAGIIDEHSHIAISGSFNECSNSITAEVRVGDVINPEDVSIYHNLSGGVTCAQLLHGSCNQIGGQSALIKLKWGLQKDQLLYQNATPFIKFALGENVKQSNWGDEYTTRYPQTRMGVEQFYIDVFDRALGYEAKMNVSKNTKSKVGLIQPCQDLQLETIIEVLKGVRKITCHSYVKSEILMIMRLAEKYGFRINTFTHILEGYKVAEEIKNHGAYASTFADWWAYKMEVIDAIPYNAAILTQKGVVTAINSDDPEMSCRLNQEAAKTIKYGGMTEQQSWKMVTINPAKMLHIDQYTGSIKIGKDADLVLWSANPLSINAKAEKTWVDGVIYYSIEQEKMIQNAMKTEKLKLLIDFNSQFQNPKESISIESKKLKHIHCDDSENEFLEY